jgi:uncharacterized protein YjiK
LLLSPALLLLSLCFSNCSDGNSKNQQEEFLMEKEELTIGYNFSSPDKLLILPGILQEISGLTNIDTTTFACIQDENGILFIYDIVNNKIQQQYKFTMDGDYEGITRVGKSMYVLRSDGTLFEISDYSSKNFKLASYDTGIPADNNEGLCYDEANNRLLIAAKGKVGKGREFKDKRVIYGFDLKTKTLSDEPAFDFDLQDINRFAQKNDIALPVKEKKNGNKKESTIKFRTSAIVIHPLTKKLYLLSASDHMLFVFDMKGTIEHIELLDEEQFNKAEGITFFDNGDMLITNEGQDKKPTLLRFNYGVK